MRLAVGLASALLGLVASEAEAHACAGCSNPNLPTSRTGPTSLAAGEVFAGVVVTGTTLRVVHAESCPEIGPICTRREEPAQLHDQRISLVEVRPIVALGATSIFGVEAQIPFRVVRTTVTFRRLDGTAFVPDDENIHHRDETLGGLSDPWILGRASGRLGPVQVTGRAGMGVPLGTTEEDPFARGRAGLSHQHIQLGAGTAHGVLALDARVPAGPFGIGAHGQGIVFTGENRHRFRPGNRWSGGAWGDVAAIAPGLRLGLGADVLNEQPERWGGVVQQDGNVGRTDVLVGGGITFARGAASASLSLRTPIWQHFPSTADHRDAGQLTYPAIVAMSAGTTWR